MAKGSGPLEDSAICATISMDSVRWMVVGCGGASPEVTLSPDEFCEFYRRVLPDVYGDLLRLYAGQVDPRLSSDFIGPDAPEVIERFIRVELGWEEFLFNVDHVDHGDDGDGAADGVYTGSPNERFEIERLSGPDWPDGWVPAAPGRPRSRQSHAPLPARPPRRLCDDTDPLHRGRGTRGPLRRDGRDRGTDPRVARDPRGVTVRNGGIAFEEQKGDTS